MNDQSMDTDVNRGDMTTAAYAVPDVEVGTNSSSLTQEMVDLELVEAFSLPNSQNPISNATPVDLGNADKLKRGEATNPDAAEEFDDSEFEDCDQYEEFMSPLDYSPIKYEESDKSSIEADDEWSDVLPEKRFRNIMGYFSPKLSVHKRPFEYDGNIHPLLIPNVVRDIFKHVDNVDDLRTCRLVNTIWNAEACEVLQKRVVVTFLDQQSISIYLTVFQNCNRVHPHAIYQFYNTNFNDSNLVLNQFLTEFGVSIKTLILQLIEVPHEKLYNVLRHQLTNLSTLWLRCVPLEVNSVKENEETSKPSGSPRTFPQLQNLIIGTRDFLHNSPTELGAVKSRQSFVKLVHLFPNLRRISISRLDHVVSSLHCVNLLRAVVAVGPNHLKYLKVLDFPLEVDEQLLSEFISLKCQYLSELDLTLTTVVRTQVVADLFNTVGPNMSKLTLTFPRHYPYGFQHVRLLGQDLQNVRELTLERFRWNLGFLEHITLLDKLIFKDTDVSSIFPSMTVEMKLRTLRIETEENSSLPRIPAPSLGRITRTFPYLKSLHISGLTDSCLRIIYFDLPCLTVMELVNGEFTDYGVTGVDLEVCKDLAETTTYLVVNADKLRTDLFIGNLTNLKNLRLESNEIGDLSILFGVCKCLKLESLYLKSSSITDLALEALADQLGHSLKALNILNCPEVSEAGKFYFREFVPSAEALVEFEPNPENERATERADASRRHRFCDSFVRRKRTPTLDNDDETDYRRAREAFAAGRGGRRFRNIHHRLHAEAHLQYRNNQAQALANAPPPGDIGEIEEVPFQLQPMNVQLENEREVLMDAFAIDIAGAEHDMDNNAPPDAEDLEIL